MYRGIDQIDPSADLVESIDDQLALVSLESIYHGPGGESDGPQTLDDLSVARIVTRPDAILDIPRFVRYSRVGDNEVFLQPFSG